MPNYIDFGNAHTCVIGMTQSGKTTAVHRSIERVRQGVIFFNTQQIEVSQKFVDVSGTTDANMIIKALRAGEKLNFIPERKRRWTQLRQLIALLYQATERSLLDVYIIVDECHLAKKEALEDVLEVFTTGIRWGIKGIAISQRPALIDNTVMNQSTQFVILKTTLEKKYLESYGFPYEAIKAGLEKGGKYAYMVYDFDSLKGAYKV